MKKYVRKYINQDALLHDKEFVVYDDVLELLNMLSKAAVEAGADKDKLLEFFNGGNSEKA